MFSRFNRFLLLWLFWGLCYTQAAKVEVIAGRVDAHGSIVSATEGVVVYYQGNTMRATRVSYDKANRLLILEGNVTVIGAKGEKEHASSIRIDTQEETVTFQELFFATRNDIWLYTNEAKKDDGNYTFARSELSSCDVEDPAWKLRFASSRYDAKERYIRLYDATMYLWGVPVLYTPYLAFSVDRHRKSGLLFPRFGYTEAEGILYEQPIYWAINASSDVEINPQIRTRRSEGVYATYRFVDSPVSSGKFRIGYFYDKASYARRYDLPDRKHYGVQFLYERDALLEDNTSAADDGLYVDITWLNDIDYLNLQRSSIGYFGRSPLQQSVINYFIDTPGWYGGINARYFIDTRLSKEDRKQTVQNLPTIQMHKYLSSFIFRSLHYTLDVQMKNYTRSRGVTMKQLEASLPVEWSVALFEDYFHIRLGESLYASLFRFGNDATLQERRFSYVNNVHQIEAFSDLTGRFGEYTHTIHPSVRYVLPGNEHTSPVSTQTLLDVQPQIDELFSVGLPREEITAALSHYLYKNGKLVFYQRLLQRFLPERSHKASDIENEMRYQSGAWWVHNALTYSFEEKRLTDATTLLSYRKFPLFVELGHTYRYDISEEEKHNDVSLGFRYTPNETFSLKGAWMYDLVQKETKRWLLGWGYHRDCWGLDVTFGTDIRPQPTDISGEVKSIREYSVYIQLSILPFAVFENASSARVFEGYVR